jgi:hypothetical protein
MVCGVSYCSVQLKKYMFCRHRTGAQNMVPECVSYVAANLWPRMNVSPGILFSFITYHSSIITLCNGVLWNSVGFYPE